MHLAQGILRPTGLLGTRLSPIPQVERTTQLEGITKLEGTTRLEEITNLEGTT